MLQSAVTYVFDQICTNPIDYDWTRAVIANDGSIQYNRRNCAILHHDFIKNATEIECAAKLFCFTYREMILRIREVSFFKTLEFFYKIQTENAYVSKIFFKTSYETRVQSNRQSNSRDFFINNGCLCILITKNVKDMWDNEYQEEIQNLINGNDALFDDEVKFHLMVNYEIIPVKTVADVADELSKIKQGYFNEIPITIATQRNNNLLPFGYNQPELSRLNFLITLILFKYYEKIDFPHRSNTSEFQELTDMIQMYAIDIMENLRSNKEKVDQFMDSLIKLRQWIFKKIKRNENLDEFKLQFTNCMGLMDTIAKKDAIFHQDYHQEDHSSSYHFVPSRRDNVYDSSNRQPASMNSGNVPSKNGNDSSNSRTTPPRHEDIPLPPENSAANYTADHEYVVATLCSLIEAFHEDYWKNKVIIANEDPRHITDIIDEVCEHSNFFLKQRPFHKLQRRVDDFMILLKSLKTEIENVIIAEAAFGKYKEFLKDCEEVLQELFNKNILPAQKDWLKINYEKGPTRLRFLDKAKAKNWETQLVITSTHWIIPFEPFYGVIEYEHHRNYDDVYLEYFTWTFDRKQEEELPEPYLILNGDRYTLAVVDTGLHFICGHLINVPLLKYVCINCKMLFEPNSCCPCRIKSESLVQCLRCWKHALGDVFKGKSYKLKDIIVIPDEPVYERTRILQPSTLAIHDRIARYLEQPSSSNITTPDRHHFQHGIRAVNDHKSHPESQQFSFRPLRFETLPEK